MASQWSIVGASNRRISGVGIDVLDRSQPQGNKRRTYLVYEIEATLPSDWEDLNEDVRTEIDVAVPRSNAWKSSKKTHKRTLYRFPVA